MDGGVTPSRLRAELKRSDKTLALYGDSAETRELRSRVKLLLGDLAGGWLELREAFRRDENLHCAYAEGDEGAPLSRAEEMKILLGGGDGRLPTAILIDAFQGKLETAFSLAWRGALRRRLLDYRGAVADLSKARKLGQRGADVLTWLGEAELQIGKTEEGLRHLKAALSRPDVRAWNFAWRGRPRLTLLRDVKGLDDLDRAIKVSPRCHLFYGWRGIARLRLGRIKEALSDLDQGLRLGAGKDARWICGWRAVALHRQGSTKALAALEAAAAEDPSYGPVISALAEALRAAKKFDRWVGALDGAARLNPNTVERLSALSADDLDALARDLGRARGPAVDRWRGRVFTLLHRPEEGLHALDASLKRQASPLSRLWRGEALNALARPEEALADFNIAAVAPSWAAFARAGKAKSLAALGRIPEAAAELDAALRLDPGSARVLADRGALRLLLGQAAAAVEDLERAVSRDPRFADALADLALARGFLGKTADEKRFLSRALAVAPGQTRQRLELWAGHWRNAVEN